MSKHNFLHGVDYWESHKDDPYNAIRHGWTADDFETRTDETIVTWFPMDLQAGDTFLDLGCGLGYACKLVAPKVETYIGVDWSQAILNTAVTRNNHHPNAFFYRNDGHRVPFLGGMFDHVISEQMFYHVPKATILGYLSEINRVLKPGGQTTLEIPKAEHYVNGLTRDDVLTVLPGAQLLDGGPDVVDFVRWRK
jgi:ubiquinone/menaquinone biosynthesis C-methylase UbiE